MDAKRLWVKKDPNDSRLWMSKRVPTEGFALLLYTARRDKGMSQSMLADAIGGDETHISRMESGSRFPSISMLRTIADTLFIKHGDAYNEFILDSVEAIANGKP